MPELSNITTQAVLDTIRAVAEINELGPDQDFYNAGLTSLASLTLLLELEDRFNIQIADDRFISCRTANDLSALIEELQT